MFDVRAAAGFNGILACHAQELPIPYIPLRRQQHRKILQACRACNIVISRGVAWEHHHPGDECCLHGM